MKFEGDHLEGLTEVIVNQITEDEYKVWVYVGIGYVLDQDGLRDAIKKALEEF
jgi:translation initiation factor 2 alpha subunit (eIF-2alpha)